MHGIGIVNLLIYFVFYRIFGAHSFVECIDSVYFAVHSCSIWAISHVLNTCCIKSLTASVECRQQTL